MKQVTFKEYFRQTGIDPRPSCLCLQGRVTDGRTMKIITCPCCNGKGYRDEMDILSLIYPSGLIPVEEDKYGNYTIISRAGQFDPPGCCD